MTKPNLMPRGKDSVGKERQATAAAVQIDDTSKVMLIEGCSINQIGALFQMDNKTVSERIREVQPCATRRGFPIYKLRDVAPYLVAPAGDIETYIKNMHPDALPTLLQHRFWQAQSEKLKFQQAASELWPTEEVTSVFTRVFKMLRMELDLFADVIERQTTFSEEQRDLLKSMTDGTLEKLRAEVADEFEVLNDGIDSDDGFFDLPSIGAL